MDRRHRAMLVQFWLTVESFKNPLESVDSGSEDDDEDAVLDPTLKEDISMMKELYFSNDSPDPALAVVSQKHVDSIRSFGLGEGAPTPTAERKVRRSVMLAQKQVEREMENDFEDFQRSELWFRVVADLEANRRPFTTSPSASGRSTPEPTQPSGNTARDGVREGHPYIRAQSSPLLSFPFQKRDRPLASLPSTPSASSRSAPSNLEVLMSPAGSTAPSSSSRAPLFDDPEDTDEDGPIEVQAQRMEAIQAALTDIIASDQRHEGRHSSSIDSRILLEADSIDSERPFDDDVDAEEDKPDDDDKPHGSYQMAGPGDLQLSYEISRLGDKIAHLETQDAMLDTLLKKAELTGDAQELRLLYRSRSSLTRELRELNFQKKQYEQQESANRLLSDRTKVAIVNSTVGEEEGKSVVRYLIEVQQLAPDGSFASGWVVARRYNEFHNMHNKLRERYALVRNLDFPGKRLVTSLSGSFVDSRRMALEKYMQVRFYLWHIVLVTKLLQSVIAIPAVCESEELRVFLSRDSPFIAASTATNTKAPAGNATTFPGQGLVRTVYQSVAESIDDMFFGPSMLDVIIQRLTSQAAEFAGIVGTGVHDEDLVAQALRASGKSTSEDTLMQLSGDLKPLDGETSTSSFSAPICDLILAVFELDKKNNWLRRQAIVIILQQVFGGTIERYVLLLGISI